MSCNRNTQAELLSGTGHMECLSHSHVLVVSLGDVGAYAAKQIYRAGVGRMTIIGTNMVNESNINRRSPALHSTLGIPKTEAVAKCSLDISPQLQLIILNESLRGERTEEILLSAPFDFAVDAIDPLSPKVYLIYQAYTRKIPIVSSMGVGAKIGPPSVWIADISRTINCVLAKAVRRRLHPLGVNERIPVVFSTEFADPDAVIEAENEAYKRMTMGTVFCMPATFGCFPASHVPRSLI